MSDTTDYIAPEDEGALLAAEYVLGVLTDEERRAVEARMALEPPLAREIAGWEGRLAGMASFVQPVTPPARTWLRIEAMVSAPAGSMPRPASLWHNLAFWRGVGIATSALAAVCLAGLLYLATLPAPPQPSRSPLLATLSGTKTKMPNFVVTIGADGRSLTIVPAALLTTDKRSMELWLIPQGGVPHSLGLIAPGQPVRINVPPALIEHVGTGAALAVSLEPLGGSPTGKPTGEVVAAGELTPL